MKKALLMTLVALLLLLTACTATDMPGEHVSFGTPEPTISTDGIDYDSLDIDPTLWGSGGGITAFTGGSGFSFTKTAAFTYSGGEMTVATDALLAYSGGELTVELTHVSNTNNWEYGFIAVLDGVVQTSEAEADGVPLGSGVMHRVRFAAGVPRTLRFTFTPNVGKAGDTLELNIVMVDNPSLAVRFNGNIAAVFGTGSGVLMAYWAQASGIPVSMESGAPVSEPPASPDIEVLSVPDEYIDAREEYLSHGSIESREDDRRQYRKVSLYSDPPGAVPGPLDSEQYLLAENGDKLTAFFEAWGEAAELRVSVFIDHELVAFSGGTYFDITESPDELKRARLDIPLYGREENGFIYCLIFEKDAEADAAFMPKDSYASFITGRRAKFLFIGSIPEPDVTDDPGLTAAPTETSAPPALVTGTRLSFEKSLFTPAYTALTEDGKLLIVDRNEDSSEAVIFDIVKNEIACSFPLPENTRLTYYAGGKLIAVQNLGFDHTGVHVFDTEGNELGYLELSGELGVSGRARDVLKQNYGSTLFNAMGTYGNLILSEDGTKMLFAEAKTDKNGLIAFGPTHLYDLTDCRDLGTKGFSIGSTEAQSLLFTGSRLIESRSDNENTFITVWDENGNKLKEWSFPITRDIRPFAISVSGGIIAIGEEAQTFPAKGLSGKLILLDTEALTETELILRTPAETQWAKLSPDGRLALTLTGEESEAAFRLYDVVTGELLREFSLENVYGPWWPDVVLIDPAERRLFIQHYPQDEDGQHKAITLIEY